MADRAQIAFRTYQLLESGHHDAKVSTWEKVGAIFGWPPQMFSHWILCALGMKRDSVVQASWRIFFDTKNWRIHFFNFVDAFLREGDPELVRTPPCELPQNLLALLAGAVEVLCARQNLPVPNWTFAVPALPSAWFVSGSEALKASALQESPLGFRKRNIFVLANFLERA